MTIAFQPAPPSRPWIMAMQWHDLLFAHWPVPVATLQRWLPAGLTLDSYDGVAWLGIVPFRMAGVRPRAVPPMPWVSAFPELNVRTYVVAQGRPGVWFFSLDAANPLAVRTARMGFHLPYMDAAMRLRMHGDSLQYSSERTHTGAPPAHLEVRYQPGGAVYQARPGTLEHWLTERYCLYAANQRGQLFRGEIWHRPWPLQPASAVFVHNHMTEQIGLQLPEVAPLLHYVRRLDVVAWWPERVRG